MAEPEDIATLKRVAQTMLAVIEKAESPITPAPEPVPQPKPDPKPAPKPEPPAPPADPTIDFEAVDLGTLKEAAAGQGAKAKLTVKTTGLSEVAYTVVRGTPPWPWRVQPAIRVPTTGSVEIEPTFYESGDFVKALHPTDYRISKDSKPVTVQQAVPATPIGASQAAAIHAKMGLGINQERYTAPNHAGARAADYYRRYRDKGIRTVRFFPSFGQSWGIDGSEGSVRPWLEAARACVDSGMPVTIFDCTDVIGYEQMGQRTDDYIRMCARLIASMNFPADSFVVGAANEWAGGTNAGYREHRFRMNGILRSILPSHTISEGPCTWKDARALYEPNHIPWSGEPKVEAYDPWPDGNAIQDVHHYLGFDTASMTAVAQSLLDWSARTGRKVFSGEWGFDDLTLGAASGKIRTWVSRFDAQTDQKAVCQVRPVLWAVTDGDAWRVNEKGSNTFRPEIAEAIPRWAAKIDGAVGLA